MGRANLTVVVRTSRTLDHSRHRLLRSSSAEQQRDPARLEYSDKIILPPSCLEKLAHLEITYPMIFEITNPRYLQRRLHCARACTARGVRARPHA